MKAIKVMLAYIAIAGAATLAFGGPGPDYMLRTKKAEKDLTQARVEAAQAKARVQVAGCANCSCAAMKKS